MPQIFQRPTLSRTVPTLNPPAAPDWNDPTTLAPQIGQQTIATPPGPSRLQNFGQDFAIGMQGGPQAVLQSQLLRQKMGTMNLDEQQGLIEQRSGLVGQQAQAQRSLLQSKMEMEREKRLQEQGNIDVVHDSKGNVWVFRKDRLAQGDVKGGAYPIISNPYKPLDPAQTVSDIEQQWGTLAPEHKSIIQSAIQDANEAKDITPFRQAEQYVAGQRRMESQADKNRAAAQDKEGTETAVTDAGGNIIGWANVKKKTFTPVGAIPGLGKALGAQEGGPPASIPLKPAGQERSRAAAAVAIEPLILKVNQMLADPNIRKRIGVLPGRVAEVERGLGNLPPDLADLYGTLKSIYSLAGTMHGWRALQVANEFEKAYGGLHTNPDSLRGGMTAMMDTARSVAAAGGKSLTTQQQQMGAGRIRVKLADGRMGTIDEKDFDPATMTKVK